MSGRKKPNKNFANGGRLTNRLTRNNRTTPRPPSQIPSPPTPIRPPSPFVPVRPPNILNIDENPFGQNIVTSTNQQPIIIEDISLTQGILSPNDWVGVFFGNVLVGVKQWDTSQCESGMCDMMVYGVDVDNPTYPSNGSTLDFKFYHSSSDSIIESSNIQIIQPTLHSLSGGVVTWDITYQQNQFGIIERLSVNNGLGRGARTPENSNIELKKGGRFGRRR